MIRDVSALPFMPLFVGQLLKSDTWNAATGDEAKAAVTLWAQAWLQVPGGTLPNDERVLAGLSGAGAKWRKVRDVALRGFKLGDDGRLHHAVIEEAADMALSKLAEGQTRTAKATAARKAKHDAEKAEREAGKARDEPRHERRDDQRDVERDETRNVHQRERERKPPTVPSEPPGEERVARERAPARAKAPAKRPLPPDFAISDRVRAWAADKGHTRLDERLEHFVGKAKANGYRYADWDEAFMTAIRDDWAKLDGKPAGGASRLTPAGQQTASALQRWVETEAKDGTNGP